MLKRPLNHILIVKLRVKKRLTFLFQVLSISSCVAEDEKEKKKVPTTFQKNKYPTMFLKMDETSLSSMCQVSGYLKNILPFPEVYIMV